MNFDFYNILLIALIAGHFFYFLVHLILMQGLKKLSKQSSFSQSPPHSQQKVSILIAIRNEEAVIQNCLECLKKQDYPSELMEVLLVNDRSTDQTPEILEKWVLKYPATFKLLHVGNDENFQMAPKKFALSKAAQKATGDIFISTDADAQFGSHWVSSLVSSFQSDTGMVLGLTTYYSDSSIPMILWGTQALELFSYSVICSSFIANRFPINSNANNMAYSKKAYIACQGMKNHGHIISGDDDFLLQQITNLPQFNIQFSIHPNSYVETKPSATIRQVWEQRKRWASKTTLYNPKQVFFLSCIYFYYMLILALLIFGILYHSLLILGIISWLIKTVMDYRVMQKGAAIFQQKKLMRWFIPTSIILIPLYILAVLFGSFGKFTWKEQTVSKTIKQK